MPVLVPSARVARWRSCVYVLGVLWVLVPLLGYAEQFTGKVVGILDGDTISVLRGGKAVKVRLHGVDTPEKAQAFGTQARKFTGDLAFQRDVTVQIRATDRYGRLVGEVLLPDGRNLNQELVKAGMAWWYRQYAPNDTTLAQLEAEARTARRGLWVDAHPVPPWQWRKGDREPARVAAPLVSATPSPNGPIIGNQKSRVYHWPGCPYYAKVSAQHSVTFPSREAAEQAGYRPAGNCR
jgi:endonuclease YncB( thermonuclease family)